MDFRCSSATSTGPGQARQIGIADSLQRDVYTGRCEVSLCSMMLSATDNPYQLHLRSTRRASLSPRLHQGFRFEGHDIYEHKKISFDSPEELYDMLMSIGSPGKYTIKYVFSRADETIAAASSTERLSLIAGKYVGKDDPVMIVRAHQNFPALGEVLEPFRYAWIIEGWMRGSHYGPLMPVSAKQATPTRVDGPPRVACLGFQLADGRLVGP